MAAGAGGGWCDALHAQGHRAFAPTLTGVGERAHLMSPLITLETHIADVASLIEAEELQDVVLAVHSYAGMIGTAIADRMPQRLKHLVYVDAVVPKPGESWSSTHASATREARLAAAQARHDYSFPAPDPAGVRPGPPRTTPGCSAARRPTRHTYQAALQFDPKRVAGRAAHLHRLRAAGAGHHRFDPPARAGCELLGRRLDRRAAASGCSSWPPGTTRWSARRRLTACCWPAPERPLWGTRGARRELFPWAENPSSAHPGGEARQSRDMAGKSKWILGAAAVAIAAAGAFFVAGGTSAAPETTFVLLDGSKKTTADLKGKVALVNFWATSCTTCVAEMPKMVSTYDKYQAKGYEHMAVAMSYDPPSYVVNFAQTRKLPFRRGHRQHRRGRQGLGRRAADAHHLPGEQEGRDREALCGRAELRRGCTS